MANVSTFHVRNLNPAFPTRLNISSTSIASSKPFRFIVGPEQREFTASAALIAHQSATLRTLIYGNFCEARNGCVTLDWVDEYTFTRFIQYAYTGDYDATSDDAVLAPVECQANPLKVQESRVEKEQLGPARRRRGVKRQRPAAEGEEEEAPKRQRLETPKVRTFQMSRILPVTA